jgi:hypothetical protein
MSYYHSTLLLGITFLFQVYKKKYFSIPLTNSFYYFWPMMNKGKTKGIKKRAAEILYINFRSMRYRLEKYGLNNGVDS